MSHPIPNAALDDRHAFIGMTGAGKTYNAGGAVERLIASGRRVIVVDPLDVWWGLRLKPDGKTASPFNVAIIGGAHGDLPLNEAAGKLIGETVATTSQSCIVSLADLQSKASERRFMIGFLDALYRKANGEPVHIVFDEADLWAPQKGGEPQLQALMENIVRRGRVKGLLSWLITQRPAVLSKDVLSQVDGLIAFKLTASQDREALGAWIEGQADRAEGKRILGALPALQRGHGVVWVPGRGILATAAFPEKITFDSSRTPKRGEKRIAGALQPLDLGALRGRLAAVEVEAKANDPKALKARIAELERAARGATPAADPAAIAVAEQRGYDRGLRDGNEIYRQFSEAVDRVKEQFAAASAAFAQAQARFLANHPVASRPAAGAAPARPAPPAPPARPRQPSTTGVALAKAERLILTALAQYPDGRTKNQIAILTGYAVNGGGFNNAISSARSAGRIQGSGDRLQITDQGLADLGPFDPLPHGDALLRHWMGQLGKAEKSALAVLAEAFPKCLSKEEVAARAGYEPSGGGFNNALSRLRSLELIEGRGELRASEALFG